MALLKSIAVILSSACSHPGLVWLLPPLCPFPEGRTGITGYAELGGTQKDPQIPAYGPAQDITPCDA